MVSDRVIGVGLVAVSIVVILVYFWLLFIPPDWKVLGIPVTDFLIRLTVMVGVLGVFGILAWIGYTLATTPPPKPIEEIEREIEEELKKLEREMAEAGAKPEAKTEGSGS